MSKKISKETAFHIFKFAYRTLIFITAVILYAIGAWGGSGVPFINENVRFILSVTVSAVFSVEMIVRLIPRRFLESLGTVKHYKRFYVRPENCDVGALRKRLYRKSIRETLPVTVFWVFLNGIFAVLYFAGVINSGVMLLLSLLWGVGDLVCVLIVCPFKLMMGNRCCASCRIYNWDMIFLVTPLIFIGDVVFLLPIILAITVFLIWEISFYIHPERFYPEGNRALSCVGCTEHQCECHKMAIKIVKKLFSKKET